MPHLIALAVSIGVLMLALTGCAGHRKITTGMPSIDKAAAPPPASSEHGRTVLRISSENTETDAAAVEQLQREDPSVTALVERLNSKPNDLDAMRRLATAYMSNNLYASAFQLYEQLRLAAPSDVTAEIGLARIWDEWGDYGMALEHANRAAALDPTSMAALETRGRIQLHRNEAGPALASFLAALELPPGNASLLANAGYACMLQQDWEQARLHLERAVEIDGSIAQAHNNLGIVLVHLGQPDVALEQFMAADTPAAAHNNLGVTYLAAGRWRDAQAEFQAALAIDPTYTLATQNLREVEPHVPPETAESIPQVASVQNEAHSFAVQIFSTKDQEFAEVSIRRLAERAGVQTVVEKSDLGEKGTWFRGRINGFESFDSAMHAAKKLLAEGLIREFWIVPSHQ